MTIYQSHHTSQRFIGRSGGTVPPDALGGLGASDVSGRGNFQFGVHRSAVLSLA